MKKMMDVLKLAVSPTWWAVEKLSTKQTNSENSKNICGCNTRFSVFSGLSGYFPDENECLSISLMKSFSKIFKFYFDEDSEYLINKFGLECRDSWIPIITDLCNQIQLLIDEGVCNQIYITQLKDKFGTLRVHYIIDENSNMQEKTKTHIDNLIHIASDRIINLAEREK